MKHGDTNLVRLKRRADFLRVSRTGERFAAPGLVLQAAPRPSDADDFGESVVGVGFTVSKKVGNAVARNRAKRRLRAVAAAVMPGLAAPNRDFVLIGRKATLRRPFKDLQGDLVQALRRTEIRDQSGGRSAS